MAREASVSDSVDPLSGLSGPSLFPHTIRASADFPLPADSKDLDSIRNSMKSLELRSPQRTMNEAKRIVDGGAEFVEAYLESFAVNANLTNAIAVKGKDKPQDRRPGLGLARKRAQFSLKTTVSQPSVNMEPKFDIDHLQDPDEYFDAYERNEIAKKEIQKQLGGSMENINHYKPSNKERRRRPGILGKSYNYRHRYSSTPAENDDIWTSSRDTAYEDITSVPVSQENFVCPDPDADMEEVDLAESTKKTESKVNDILEGLLSCNHEDLEGLGALNLLQERLNIKPLDRGNLCMAELRDVGRTNITTASKIWQKTPRKSSVDIDSVLKNLSNKPHKERELAANAVNPASSPTPPRSPFASLNSLKKRILQPNPLRDPFSALSIDSSAWLNASPGQHRDRPLGQVDAPKDAGTSRELESCVEDLEVHNAVPPISDIDAQEVMGNADNLLEQFVDENASTQRTNTDTSPIASPAQLNDKLFGKVDTLADLGMPNELHLHVEVINTEPAISNTDAHEVMRDTDSLPGQSVDEISSIQHANADSRPSEGSANIIEKTMNIYGNESNPSVLEEEARDGTSNRRQLDPQQPPEVHAAKPHRGKSVTGEKCIRNAHPMSKSPAADESVHSLLEEEARDVTSSRQPIVPEQPPEVHAANLHGGKRAAGAKRIRDSHPMRKSLAEAGTAFETGVRRCKRIRMRPLEYWRGERFVYGRVDESLKLLGVKYFSPGKVNADLKVKPYIPLEKPEYKEVLDLAARY